MSFAGNPRRETRASRKETKQTAGHSRLKSPRIDRPNNNPRLAFALRPTGEKKGHSPSPPLSLGITHGGALDETRKRERKHELTRGERNFRKICCRAGDFGSLPERTGPLADGNPNPFFSDVLFFPSPPPPAPAAPRSACLFFHFPLSFIGLFFFSFFFPFFFRPAFPERGGRG